MKRSFITAGCFSDNPSVTNNNNATGSKETNNSMGSNNTVEPTTGQSSGTSSPSCMPTSEVCDQKDNDCDGQVDEELGDTCCFGDSDCDGKLCDLVAHACVECLDNSACTNENAAKCNSDSSCAPCESMDDCLLFGEKKQCSAGACVVCAGDRDCENEQKCDLTKNVCATCLIDTDCNNQKCLTDGDPTKNTCVECVSNTDCLTVENPQCDDTNLCASCRSNADCTHLPDTLACNAGTCVECTVDSDCPGTACDLSTNKCSNQVLGSGVHCSLCVSDSACDAAFDCISTKFKGAPDGQYCLERKVGACDAPYSSTIVRASVSGLPAAPHCGVNENLTSCYSVTLSGKVCPVRIVNLMQKTDCGRGGVCHELSSFLKVCNNFCDNASECKSGVPCTRGLCRRPLMP